MKILFAKEYSSSQKTVLECLRKQTFDENNKIISLDEKGNPNYKNEILSNNTIDKNLKKNMLEFASFKLKEVEQFGLEALDENLKLNEEEVLKENIDLFKKLAKLKEIEIVEYSDNIKPKGIRDSAIPGKPIFVKE